MLRAEARRNFQVIIDYIKEQVGEGVEYNNGMVRVVISDRGCYYEFLDMPEEFSGALGSGFQYEFVGTGTGLLMAEQTQYMIAHSNDENTRELSLLSIYDRRGLFDRDAT